MVLPLILIESRLIVSPGVPGFVRFLIVILTARSAVFIWGETEVIVPWTMVPFLSSIVTVSLAHFMRNLYGTCQLGLLLLLKWKKTWEGCADSSETHPGVGEAERLT